MTSVLMASVMSTTQMNWQWTTKGNQCKLFFEFKTSRGL